MIKQQTNKWVKSVASCAFAKNLYCPSICVVTISSMVTFDFNIVLVNVLYKKCSSGYFKELKKAIIRYCTREP
jgi:hypothetical protein